MECIENDKMIDSGLSDKYDKVSKLYELYSNVSKHIELEEVFKSIKNIIIDILHVDVVGIHLYNDNKDKLTINYIFGVSEELSICIKELKSKDNLTGVILRERKPLFFHLDDYPETKYKHVVKKEGIKNMELFPIIYENNVIGLMFIGNKSYDEEYRNKEEIVESFCFELGGLIKNSLLYDKIKNELNEKNENEVQLLKEREEVEESKKVAQDNFTNLDLLFKNLDAIIWKIGKDGRIMVIDGKELEKLGVDKNELIGKSIYEVADRKSIDIDYIKLVLRGEPCEYDKVCGEKIFHIKYSTMYDKNGSVSYAVGLAMDITKIKSMEKKLLENETRFMLASEGAGIGWWHWNIENNVLNVDNRLASFVGCTFEELDPLSPTTWNKFIYNDDLEKSKNMLKKYFNGEVGYYECEFRVKHRDGSIKWVLNRGKIIERDECNKPLRMSGVYIDITEKKKAEEIELLLIKKEEEEKIRNEFFANISHELRTPINVIYSAVQLEDRYILNLDKDRILKYNKTIKQNCLRLIKMTNNIIDITRLETGFFNPIFKIENIVPLIEEITLSIISYADMKNIRVTFDTEIEEIYVNCDSNLIERIILNILSNSVKYGRKNGFIEVNVTKESNDVVGISIKDDGVGIPLDLQSKVFERFERVDNGFSRSNEGSGIGLSIVKSLVEIQGGTIEIKSEVNKGAEFILKFKMEDVDYNHGEVTDINQENHIIEKVDVEFSDIYI